MTIDELLETRYWVIDILPEQVGAGAPGQYFEIERYWLEPSRIAAVKRKHLDLILKLNCYRSVSLDEEETVNPDPERIEEAVLNRYVCILTGESMIVSEPDDLCLTLYNPDGRLLDLVRRLAAGEGLYVWKPEQQSV